MQSRKTIFLLMIIPLMGMVAFSQNFLNKQRGELSVAYLEPLRNADPLVKFTSEALGGFRGVIATVLWMRINNLQLEGKFLEMVQLSEWITKLQPHTPTVWTDRAWNLAYNVSVKETDVEKRYKWVMAGISLLRDEAIDRRALDLVRARHDESDLAMVLDTMNPIGCEHAGLHGHVEAGRHARQHRVLEPCALGHGIVTLRTIHDMRLVSGHFPLFP